MALPRRPRGDGWHHSCERSSFVTFHSTVAATTVAVVVVAGIVVVVFFWRCGGLCGLTVVIKTLEYRQSHFFTDEMTNVVTKSCLCFGVFVAECSFEIGLLLHQEVEVCILVAVCFVLWVREEGCVGVVVVCRFNNV